MIITLTASEVVQQLFPVIKEKYWIEVTGVVYQGFHEGEEGFKNFGDFKVSFLDAKMYEKYKLLKEAEKGSRPANNSVERRLDMDL